MIRNRSKLKNITKERIFIDNDLTMQEIVVKKGIREEARKIKRKKGSESRI